MGGMISQILMMAMSGKFNANAAQNPAIEGIHGSLFAVSGNDNKATRAEVEKQIAKLDTQLATMQIFAAIPQFAPYVTSRMTEVKQALNHLQLIDDNFDAFSGSKNYINTKVGSDDLDAIDEAAEADGNEVNFSEEDLEELYEMRGLEYEASEEDFALSSMSFDDKIGNKSGDQDRVFDEDSSDMNILVKDKLGNDTYTVGEDVENSKIVFTNLNDGDKLNLDGKWSSEQIETEDGLNMVLYKNQNTGSKVYVAGSLSEMEDLVNVDSDPYKAPNKTSQDKLINSLYNNILGRDAEQGGFEAWEKDTASGSPYGINLTDGITKEEKVAMVKKFIAGSMQEIASRGISTEQLMGGICDTLGAERAGMYCLPKTDTETNEEYLARLNSAIDTVASFAS